MATIVFPTNIVYAILQQGNMHVAKPLLVESSSDYPVYKARQVGTFVPVQYSFNMSMDNDNRKKFYDFFTQTLKGYKPFEWVDPYDKNRKISCRIIGEPASTETAIGVHAIKIKIETVHTADV